MLPKPAKNLARQIAKQIAQEPLEVLKTARHQVTGQEVVGQSEKIPQDRSSEQSKEVQKEQIDKTKSIRRMEALEKELQDIERDKLFKELQRKIAEGIDVYLEEYPELSLEQKQVLKAQMEAVKSQISNLKSQSELVEPAAKKGRQLFNFGKKQEVKRQQTHVEKIVPPSG